jgi:hypothetical protein
MRVGEIRGAACLCCHSWRARAGRKHCRAAKRIIIVEWPSAFSDNCQIECRPRTALLIHICTNPSTRRDAKGQSLNVEGCGVFASSVGWAKIGLRSAMVGTARAPIVPTRRITGLRAFAHPTRNRPPAPRACRQARRGCLAQPRGLSRARSRRSTPQASDARSARPGRW